MERVRELGIITSFMALFQLINEAKTSDACGIFEILVTGLPYRLRFIYNRCIKLLTTPVLRRPKVKKYDKIAKIPPPPYRLRLYRSL